MARRGGSHNGRLPEIGHGTHDADVLYGTEEADKFQGQSGNDTMYGLGGNDTFSGGNGSDLIYGGAGRDKFIIRPGDEDNHDIIFDFEAGEVVDMRGPYTVMQIGNDVRIELLRGFHPIVDILGVNIDDVIIV